MLAIDPASKEAGVALFNLDGTLIETWHFSAGDSTWGLRLRGIAEAFAECSIPHEEVTEVAIESLKGASNSPMLNAIAGIFLQYLPNATLRTKSFITPSAWKAYIRKTTGEKSPLPKGVDSLVRYDPSMPGTISDDEADAVMIGLTFIHTRL